MKATCSVCKYALCACLSACCQDAGGTDQPLDPALLPFVNCLCPNELELQAITSSTTQTHTEVSQHTLAATNVSCRRGPGCYLLPPSPSQLHIYCVCVCTVSVQLFLSCPRVTRRGPQQENTVQDTTGQSGPNMALTEGSPADQLLFVYALLLCSRLWLLPAA